MSSSVRLNSARRSRVRIINLHCLLLAVNLVIRALNVVYFHSISLNSKNDANRYSFVYLSDLNTLCLQNSRFHVLHSIYYRTQFIFTSLLCDCRCAKYHQSTFCSDRTMNSYYIYSILNELSTYMSLPINLNLNYYVKHVRYRHVNLKIPKYKLQIPIHTSFYTTSVETGAIPLVADLVSLPSINDVVNNVELKSVLPSTIFEKYYDVNALLLPIPIPLPNEKRPSVFTTDRHEYIKLLRRLIELKMVAFTDSPKCINGAFGVVKDETKIRLIIDATFVNSMMIPPPVVILPNPGHLSNLKSNSPFYVCKTDLSNYYHQLQLPIPLQEYFCLPGLSAAELKSILPNVTVKRVRMYPKLLTLAMGWSHSVYIAQAVHEHVLYSMYAALSPVNNILINCVLLSTLNFIYIDDLVMIGYDRNELEQQLVAVEFAYSAVGLKVNRKKSIAPTKSTIKIIGVSINGSSQRIFVSGNDFMPLIHRTIEIIKIGECTAHSMSQLIGHWCWFILTKRPFLSIMNQCYRFIQVFGLDVQLKSIWNSVRRELILLCSIAPLLQINCESEISNRVVCTDASMRGFGVVSNRISEMNDELYHNLVELAVNVETNSLECEANAFGIVGSISEVINSVAVPIQVDSAQPVIALTNTNRNQQHQQIVHLVRHVVETIDWIVITHGQWKYNNISTHINELEMSSVLLAVRWLCSLVLIRSLKRTVVILVDNAVTVYSIRKGRSSSLPLLNLLRRISCYLIAFDVQLKIIYVPSSLNPADAASRSSTN